MIHLDAVLFDFSGTLFRLDYSADALAAMLDGHPLAVPVGELLRRITTPAGIHAGLTPEQERDWHNRDLDPAAHQRANIAVLQVAGLPAELAAAFYGGMLDAASWRPYPDTADVLRLLRERGIPVGVLSNIAWDLRPCFEQVGIADLVDEYVFSFEEGVEKPNAKIFRTACERLGADPARVLMIGDSEEADGGARTIGCRFAKVEPLPVGERPDALISIIRAELGGA